MIKKLENKLIPTLTLEDIKELKKLSPGQYHKEFRLVENNSATDLFIKHNNKYYYVYYYTLPHPTIVSTFDTYIVVNEVTVMKRIINKYTAVNDIPVVYKA